MIEGWMGKGPRKWLRRQAKRHRRIVEVGVWKGKSTAILARHTTGTVWAVDHWRGTPHDAEQHARYQNAAGEAAFSEFCANLREYIDAGKVVPVPLPSVEAADALAHKAPFDLVFIDADHGLEAVKADIAAWLPLVAPGGLLAGHDYNKDEFPGVSQAVDEVFGDRAVIGPASIWSVQL